MCVRRSLTAQALRDQYATANNADVLHLHCHFEALAAVGCGCSHERPAEYQSRRPFIESNPRRACDRPAAAGRTISGWKVRSVGFLAVYTLRRVGLPEPSRQPRDNADGRRPSCRSEVLAAVGRRRGGGQLSPCWLSACEHSGACGHGRFGTMNGQAAGGARFARRAKCASSAVHTAPCRSLACDRGCVPPASRGRAWTFAHAELRCSAAGRANTVLGIENLSPGSDPGPANRLPRGTVRVARAKRTRLAVGAFSVRFHKLGVNERDTLMEGHGNMYMRA